MASGITFRKIRGKIIPIKLNPNKAQRHEAYKMMAAGAVVAAGGAAIAAGALLHSDVVAKRLANALSNVHKVGKYPWMNNMGLGITKSSEARLLKVGAKGLKNIAEMLKTSKRVLNASAITGSALMAAGATQAVRKKDSKWIDPLAFAGGGYLGHKVGNKVFKSLIKKRFPWV